MTHMPFMTRLRAFASCRLIEMAKKIYTHPTPEPTAMEQIHAKWLAVNGEKTLRVDYPLNSSSIVLDVGGFEGQWASDIYARYLCNIHIFEPVPKFAKDIESRFAKNQMIKIHQVALGAENGSIEINIEGDASSTLLGGDSCISVQQVAFSDWYQKIKSPQIALMKINIEGGEYALLDHLIKTRLINRIDQLQIQFHNFIHNAESLMSDIQLKLAETHEITYQFPFIWENWKRKGGAE